MTHRCAPALLAPQEAWICQYEIVNFASATSNGAAYDWKLSGAPEPVSAERLPALSDALDDLSVIDGGRECPADLGPRSLVVWNHDGDLTAAVVDNYGCRSVRLTDDPHATPPGADDQEGTVAGVLAGGQAILDALGSSRKGR